MESIQIPGYELLHPLGSGGMATVYLALQRSLDRRVAIKVMRRAGDASSADALQFERRFLLEGRTMALLPHRNIAAVYDIVTTPDIAYIAMEYLDGGTLSERMLVGMQLNEVLSVVVQIANALEFAHSKGIVHRDLKAPNIMFREQVVPVLTDFGIARQQDSLATALTQTGMMVGTPHYMSPEQINGVAVDGRSDQYSLGILFYELLAGAQPFDGDTPLAILMAHLTKEPPPLPIEFQAFQHVVSRMLAKDREQRYPNLSECVVDLKSHLTQSDTLMMRLQFDPEQSSSDQLHNIGFGASTPSGVHSGGWMARTLAIGTRKSNPKLLGIATKPASASKKPRWQWLAAAAGVLVLGLVLWMAIGGKHKLSQDEANDLVSYRLGLAEQSIKAGQLIVPAEGSAFEYLQKVLQVDTENKRANELLDQIAHDLGVQAQAQLAAGKFDEALELSLEGLLVRPNNADVRAIKGKIVVAQKVAQQQQQIADLLQNAESARISGRALGDKGAYALLNQARTLAPTNAEIQQRIKTLIDGELAAVQRSLDTGDLTAATAALARLEPYIESEPAYVAAKSKLAATMGKQQTETAIAAIVERANMQLRSGKLVAPGGDNASESLGELRKLASADRRTGELAKRLSQTLLAEAKRQDAANQPTLAIDNAELALQADPQATDAQLFKAQIEKRLGQRATDLASALSAIQLALSEQRFVPPAANDAHTALEALLKLDPENVKARELLADLPKRISASAAASAAKDASAANELVAAALKVYPQDAALMRLQAQVSAQLGREVATREAQERRGRIATLLAASSPNGTQLQSAAKELDALLASNDTSEETLKLRTRLIAAIGNRIGNPDDPADFDATAAILDSEKKNLSADASYAALVAARPDLRAKAVFAEQARLDAQRGELVLNAFPWANVESVLDANRKAVSLPTDAITPVRLTLPAGSYIITFKHPQATKPVQVIARVEAKKQIVANASFPTISASGYFSRAGW